MCLPPNSGTREISPQSLLHLLTKAPNTTQTLLPLLHVCKWNKRRSGDRISRKSGEKKLSKVIVPDKWKNGLHFGRYM
ncbi:uncharacterized protein [Henckelia pumila]|uniref:uncharacterized protein isoform X2 n=1 Tax=Henckelia pumila TaxID=405737 RepID=UPI003C6DCFE8